MKFYSFFTVSLILFGIVQCIDTNSTIIGEIIPRSGTGRALIFNKGGTIRMICGILCPTFIPNWQNINVLTNWSVGFALPTLAHDWFSKLAGNVNWARYKQSREISDSTREMFYKFIEEQFNKYGRKGHECLLRTICEVAEAPIKHNGLLGELFHLVFTPGDEELVSEDYKAAKKAGYHGVDCQKTFQECPYGHGILEKYSVVGMFTSKLFLNAFKN